MSVLEYIKGARIVRSAPTQQDLENHVNLLTLFEITSIVQGAEGPQGTHWYSFYSSNLLVGTLSDITEVKEKCS